MKFFFACSEVKKKLFNPSFRKVYTFARHISLLKTLAMDKNWICVFPTNDGIHFANEHFGEADFFDIYQIGKEEITFLKRVKNMSPEERGHGDPNKAKSIMQTLKKEPDRKQKRLRT